MRVKLIKPDLQGGRGLSLAESIKVQHLALPLLASLTPPEHEVVLVDESYGPDDVDEDVDLVGISVLSDVAHRAYEVADGYRARGVPVVLGGVHPSVLPDEGLRHADAVVVGEAEGVWNRVVGDAARGSLGGVYQARGAPDLGCLPMPRRELYPRLRARSRTPSAATVEASRGCPFDCDFCSVHRTRNERGYRQRPLQHVLADLATLEVPRVLFVDDNLALDREAAKALFRDMAGMGIQWTGQGSVALAQDVELLRLMRRSGCLGLLLGFESVASESQQQLAKLRSLKLDFGEALRRFHGEGLAVLGSFVMGMDCDDESVFDRTLEFITAHKLTLAAFRPLVPFPGTRAYARLEAEGRLVEPEWWLHADGPGHWWPTYRPARMSRERLLEGLQQLTLEFYSLPSIARRCTGVPPWRWSLTYMALYWGANTSFRRRYRNAFLESAGAEPAC